MIQAIALRFGYVESNVLSWFVFQPEIAFKTKKEAFHSLAEFLYQRYLGDHPSKIRTCCKKSAEDPENEFCPKCGRSLDESAFDYYQWCEDLERFRVGTIDGSGYMGDDDNPAGWDPSNFGFGIPNKNMIIVHENGIEMLGYAVAELHPELKEKIHGEINDCFYDDYLKIVGK
jgi:hypothetical protein